MWFLARLGPPWGRVKAGINESEVAAVMLEATSKSRYRCPRGSQVPSSSASGIPPDPCLNPLTEHSSWFPSVEEPSARVYPGTRAWQDAQPPL